MKTLDKMRRLFQKHSASPSSQAGEQSSPSRTPQQQQQSSSLRKNFGPSSGDGRPARSATPDCGPPRGGSPYPQPLPTPAQPGSKPSSHNGVMSEDEQPHLDQEAIYAEIGPPDPGATSLVAAASAPQREFFGLRCDICNRRLVELKRQALRIWMPIASARGVTPVKVRPFKTLFSAFSNSLQTQIYLLRSTSLRFCSTQYDTEPHWLTSVSWINSDLATEAP